ncbi:hypothetical protein KGF56_004083 [Candida oxycetoniae]|uniref:DUF7871 domain-containing protein n=1 Tax=Candida oxycetoniae TaxID=497107 RepID=A0AAI9SVD2_9ASCO|nr:uncharacterized protein KGF56_004083 [Candida oxycetoniae]KAI3403194.1 hypothetical protein KGF56_004083 [Candida oxycetoniae]
MVCTASQCVCAQKSTCSCGARPALQCTCDKADTENVKPSKSDACSCGLRNKNNCTCGANANCDGSRAGETDFTNLK